MSHDYLGLRWTNQVMAATQQAQDNVGLMLGRRRRRRVNIGPTLVQCLVFAGYVDLMCMGLTLTTLN